MDIAPPSLLFLARNTRTRILLNLDTNTKIMEKQPVTFNLTFRENLMHISCLETLVIDQIQARQINEN